MSTVQDTTIIGFDPEASTNLSICATCGTPQPFGAFCEGCIGSLLDLALLDDAREEYPCLVDQNGTEPEYLLNSGSLPQGRYEVSQTAAGLPWELGRGSMGVTYRAFDTELHRLVALKVVHPVILGDSEAGELFLREARSAAQIRHQNIATIYDLGRTASGDCFYAMEFVEGETLEDRVRREGALHHETALGVVAQAARGLCSAHAQGFVHRDLKPTNIMLAGGRQSSGEEAAVKLIDFGLVKTIADEVSDVIRIGYFAGTPHYASPEQLEGRGVGVLSDIYSLGRCLWFMLSGQIPVTRSLAEAEFPMDVPPCVKGLLKVMVMDDPTARPQTAAAVVKIVDECLGTLRDENDRQCAMADRQCGVPSKHSAVGSRKGVWMVAAVLLGFVVSVAMIGKNHASKEARALYAQGENLRHRHTKADNQVAMDLLSKAVLADPDFADAHAALAMTLFHDVAEFGAPPVELDRAVASANRALAINPNAVKAFHALGAIDVSRGHPWEALGNLHRALELDAGYVPAMRDFASLWTSVGQPQMGLAWAKTAARVDPSNLFIWIVTADAYTDLCADEEAEDCFRRCLAINPMSMQAHNGLIHIYLWQGNFAHAREELLAAEPQQFISNSLPSTGVAWSTSTGESAISPPWGS